MMKIRYKINPAQSRKRRTRLRGQSMLEYAILIAVISAAFSAMFVYFQRSVNSRLEDLRQEYSPDVAP